MQSADCSQMLPEEVDQRRMALLEFESSTSGVLKMVMNLMILAWGGASESRVHTHERAFSAVSSIFLLLPFKIECGLIRLNPAEFAEVQLQCFPLTFA